MKLLIDTKTQPLTITIIGTHTCLKSSHESFEKKVMRHKLKQNISKPHAGTLKQVFDDTYLQ